jgi:hypothetical protein
MTTCKHCLWGIRNDHPDGRWGYIFGSGGDDPLDEDALLYCPANTRRHIHEPATGQAPAVVGVWPKRTEVAVLNLPAGTTARVIRPWDDAAETVKIDTPEQALTAALPGDRELLGWGCRIIYYFDYRVIAHGKHRRDRHIWQQAVKAIQRGGVAYLQHEQQDYYGKQVWVATGLRTEERT